MGTNSLYFIGIIPPPDICKQISSVKKEFVDRFNSSYSYRRIPHITLQKPFTWPDSDQSDLQFNLRKFVLSKQSFGITLSNFGHFGEHVIFIDVKKAKPLLDLQRSLEQFLLKKLNFTKKMLDHRAFKPHITVANRDLSNKDFKLAWSEFKNRPFSCQFNCDVVWLLKHNGERWDPFCPLHLKTT